MLQSAIVSLCERYRYQLTRCWNPTLPNLVFIMLNPSTADASVDDATIRRCMGFSRDSGFGGIRVLNLYAFRATSPSDMRAAVDPVGPNNNRVILEALNKTQTGDMVICAWGANARNDRRAGEVLELIAKAGHVPHTLKLLGGDVPGHPLYLAASRRPERWFPLAGPLSAPECTEENDLSERHSAS